VAGGGEVAVHLVQVAELQEAPGAPEELPLPAVEGGPGLPGRLHLARAEATHLGGQVVVDTVVRVEGGGAGQAPPHPLHPAEQPGVLARFYLQLPFPLLLFLLLFSKTLSQLNDSNAVQKWSFSKCCFSTCIGSKNKGKHVYGDVVVFFLQKNPWGASWRPPGGPRVTPIL